jgi:hypothetical protein
MTYECLSDCLRRLIDTTLFNKLITFLMHLSAIASKRSLIRQITLHKSVFSNACSDIRESLKSIRELLKSVRASLKSIRKPFKSIRKSF